MTPEEIATKIKGLETQLADYAARLAAAEYIASHHAEEHGDYGQDPFNVQGVTGHTHAGITTHTHATSVLGGTTVQAEIYNVGSGASALTVTDNEVTVTQSWHYLRGEGGVADVLEFANGGDAGDLLILQGLSEDITIVDNAGGAGEFQMVDGQPVTLADEHYFIWFLKDDIQNAWMEQGRSFNSATTTRGVAYITFGTISKAS